MQAVTDLQLLEIAEMGVQLAERGLCPLRRRDTAVLVESGLARELENLAAEQLAAPRVEPRSVKVLIHQPFQLSQRAIAFGAGQRRRQMIDDDRAGSPL